MARVVYGPLVSNVKGSIGGVTFQGNPSGSIIRTRPQLSRVSTNKQTTSHGKLQYWLYQWQNITQDQRDQWNMFAQVWVKENKFGEEKTLTGWNWFFSVNWWRKAMDLSQLSSPPAHNVPPSAPSFGMELSAGDIVLRFLEAFDFTLNNVAVWSSAPTRRNTLSINQIRKLVTVIKVDPGDTLDITSTWETAVGIDWNPAALFPNANVYFCLEAINKSSGITSPMLCTKNDTPSDSEDSIYYYI